MREILVDSSAVIRALDGSADERLSSVLADCIPIISIIAYAEVTRYFVRNKSEAEWSGVKSDLCKFRILGMDAETCEIAAKNAKTFGLSLADSLIYATAIRNGLPLLTCDADFKGKKDVIYVK